MNCEILIVSHQKDLPYLRWCLRSIRKFGSGFSGVTVLHPRVQQEAFSDLTLPLPPENWFPVICKAYDEFTPKGMLDHEAQILCADRWCPEADHVLHMDSDQIFRERVTPADFFHGSKPVLLKEPYARLKTDHPGRYAWKKVTEESLGFECPYETMCRPGMVNPRFIYEEHRKFLEDRWKLPIRYYYLTGKNEFPQSLCEFNSLGAYALKFFEDAYHWIEVPKEPRPHDKILQAWSHGPIDKPQTIWMDGKEVIVIPELLFSEVLA